LNGNINHKLFKILKKNIYPFKITTSKDEVSIRCPYCGDSLNTNSTHLYISTEEPFLFHCKKCNASGVVNYDLLHKLGIFNSELDSLVSKISLKYSNNINKNNKKINNISFKNNLDIVSFINYDNHKNKIANKNLNYLNKRFNLNWDFKDYGDKFNIIWDLKDFFSYNEINKSYTSDKKLLELFETGIGFLSYDKSYIIFRNRNNKGSYRYYNLLLIKNVNNKKFYTIKQNVSVLQPKLNVIMAEGIFDIIGVFLYMKENKLFKENTNNIFISCNGKSFNQTLSYINYMGFLNNNLYIFSDSDVKIKFYKSILYNNYFIENFYLFYNIYNKDYGVSVDKINLKKYKLK